MPFPNIATFNIIITKSLTYRLYIISHSDTIGYHAVCMRKRPCKDCTSGRAAYRLTGICILVTDSLFSQTVQIRCIHLWITITANHIFPGCVCHQKNTLSFHLPPPLLIKFIMNDSAYLRHQYSAYRAVFPYLIISFTWTILFLSVIFFSRRDLL